MDLVPVSHGQLADSYQVGTCQTSCSCLATLAAGLMAAG
jgi:hypothetical protein